MEIDSSQLPLRNYFMCAGTETLFRCLLLQLLWLLSSIDVCKSCCQYFNAAVREGLEYSKNKILHSVKRELYNIFVKASIRSSR